MSSGNLWNVIFVIFFILAIVAYVYYFRRQLMVKQQNILAVVSYLASLESDSIVITYESLRDTFSNNEVLSSAWKKYEKTLVKTGDNEGTIIHSTVDADCYFSVPDFTLDLSINFWQNLAGIFTGLGILGTFVGITVGLYGMDTSTNVTLQKGITGLLDGTKTAFITSVIGIVLAIIFNWYHNTRLMRTFTQVVNDLSNELDRLFPRTSIEIILCDSLSEYKEQTETLKAFSTDLAMSIGNALDNTIQAEFKPVFTELLVAIKALNNGGVDTIAASINDNAGEALKNFALTLNGLQETMQHSLEDSQKISQQNSNQMRDSVKELVDLMHQETAASVVKQQESIQGLSTQLTDLFKTLSTESQLTSKEILTALQETVKDTIDSTQKVNAENNGQLQNAVKDLVELMRSETAASVTKQQENTSLLSTQLTELFTHLQNNSQIASAEMLSALQASVRDMVENIQKVNGANNDQLQSAVKDLVDLMRQETANSVTTQQDNITQLSKQMIDLFTTLNTNSQSTSKELFTGMKSGLETSLESTLTVIKENNQQMKESVQSLLELMRKETADTVTSQQENVKEMTKSLVGVFGELEEKLRATTKCMEDASNSTTDNLTSTLAETAAATEKLANQLKTGSDIIRDTLKSSDMLVKNAGETADKFNKASKPVEKVAAEMGRQMSLVVEAENTFNQSVQKNTELLSEAVKGDLDTIRNIKEALDKTESAWNAYENHFKGVSSELENSFTKLQQGLTSYNDLTSTGLNKTLTAYDKHISSVLGKISQLVDELNEPVEELTEYLNKKSRR